MASIAAGLTIRGQRSDGEAAFVQQDDQGNTIYRYQFYETLHVGEVGKRALVPLVTTKKDIDEIFIPENDSHVMGELSRWVVWRSEDTVNAFLDMAKEPLQWSAPQPIGGVLSTVNKISNGPLEILVVSKTGDTLWLLHAEGGFGVPQPALKLVWTAPLKIPATSLFTVVPPQGITGDHHLLGVEEKTNSYAIHQASFTQQKLGAAREALITDGEFFSHVAPTAKVDQKNNLSVATLMTKAGEESVQLVLVETRFTHDGKIEQIRSDLIEGIAPDDIESGTFAYSRIGSNVERLDLVLVKTNGEILKLKDTKMAPVAVMGTPPKPLKLFSASDSTYILYYLPDEGYYFEII